MHNFQHYPCFSFHTFLEEEMVRGRYRNILFHDKWPIGWLSGQGLGRNITGKLVTRRPEKKHVDGSLQKGKFVFHVNVHQRKT